MIYFVKLYFHCIKEEITLEGSVCSVEKCFITITFNQIIYLFTKILCKNQTRSIRMPWSAIQNNDDVCVCYCECVRLVRALSLRGTATLVSLCHWGVVTWGGGVRTLWATPGAFSSDHNSSPRVTMATRSSSSEHQATGPPLVTVLSLERNRDTLKWKEKK